MESDDENVPYVETWIDFTNSSAKVNQVVYFEEKLVEERRLIFESHENLRLNNTSNITLENDSIIHDYIKEEVLATNFVFIFIDSLSRDNFRRKLTKSKKWLDDRYENFESSSRSYQFLRYHGIASWTLANMIPVQFGVNYLHEDEATSHIKYYHNRGYVSGQSHTLCGRDIIDLEPGNLEKFSFETYDHEHNNLYCDPNFSIPGSPYSLFQGIYSIQRRCLYSHDSHHYVYDFGKKFWETYTGVPKYLRLGFLDAHEGTAEVIKYMDDHLVDFLDFITKSEDWENTMIILMSDHGENMPGFYSFIEAEDFIFEKTLPTHYWILPKNKADLHHKVLKSNEQKFTTPYDIHNTLLHICQAPKYAHNNLGQSLFTEIDDSKRTCTKFNIDKYFCNCLDE